ncbi:MAG: histidine phosphatase family protein [Planctomycetaceae bacterium]|nr:histidine phosphatase family protein [Planctomycetaceae bacterium]
MLCYLIRHGESAYNVEGRIQGQANVPLTELGRKQALALGNAFRDQQFDALFSSPLDRAYHTAEPVAAALELPIQTDDRLKELNAGVFQGLVWNEIVAQHPEAAARWKSLDPDYRIPGGESRRDLVQRALAVIESIRSLGHKRVVIVAHGGLLSAGLKGLLDIPAERNPFMLYNGSISTLHWGEQFKVLTLNQIDHLHLDGERLDSRMGDL